MNVREQHSCLSMMLLLLPLFVEFAYSQETNLPCKQQKSLQKWKWNSDLCLVLIPVSNAGSDSDIWKEMKLGGCIGLTLTYST